MQQNNVELVREAYAAWNSGDIDSVVAMADEDFEWLAPPDLVGARGGRGRDDFATYLRSFSEVWDDFRCEPQEFWSAGETVLVLVRETGCGKLSGARVHHHLVHVWTIRDGRTVRMESYVERPDTLERLLPAQHDRRPTRAARMSLALAFGA
jgi:ketosteroid isomerase-like protein